jgi:hypothetical protein
MQPEEFSQRVSDLTNHQWKLLEVLIQAGNEWVTRRQIAHTIGKRRLIPYDIGCLEALEEQELVNIDRVADTTPIGFQVVYRVSDKTTAAHKQIHLMKHNDEA